MRHVLKTVPSTVSRSRSRSAVGSSIATAVAMLLVMAIGASAAFARSEFKFSSFPDNFEGKGGRVTIEAEHGSTVTCEKSETKGKMTGFTLLEVAVTYSGNCELKSAEFEFTEKCPTITSSVLLVETVDKLNKGTKAGLYYKPKSGAIAEFTCEGSHKVKVKVTGSVICESTPIAKATTKLEVICKRTAKAGEQEFTEATNSSGKVFTAFLKAEGFPVFGPEEKDALITTEVLTFIAPIEQTA